MSAFDELPAIAPIDIWNGVLARAVVGEQCSFAVVELTPGSVVAEHSHPNEQLGILVRGSGTFRVGDEMHDVGPGSTWRIPANVPHELTVGDEGAVAIDVFAPARDDWKALERSQPQSPRWP